MPSSVLNSWMRWFWLTLFWLLSKILQSTWWECEMQKGRDGKNIVWAHRVPTGCPRRDKHGSCHMNVWIIRFVVDSRNKHGTEIIQFERWDSIRLDYHELPQFLESQVTNPSVCADMLLPTDFGAMSSIQFSSKQLIVSTNFLYAFPVCGSSFPWHFAEKQNMLE